MSRANLHALLFPGTLTDKQNTCAKYFAIMFSISRQNLSIGVSERSQLSLEVSEPGVMYIF